MTDDDTETNAPTEPMTPPPAPDLDSHGSPPRVLAEDPHDRRLLGEVRPADWVNPQARGRYHLLVIGGGTAGLVTAAIGAALGARVALVERAFLGGDCLNFGCVPSKALIEASRSWRQARESAAAFGGPEVTRGGDFSKVMERMREIRATIATHDSAARFRGLGVDVYLGEGAFTGRSTLRVGEQELAFRRAVVATGTRAAVPDVPGLEGSGYRTNETIFSLTKLPRRLAVLGGGATGCELAQAFARFGSEVTIVESSARLLSRQDPEAAAIVERALEADGVEVLTDARVTGVRVDGEARVLEVAVGGTAREIEVDELLVAAGRTPNLEGLGLERAGVESDPHRGVRVDERMRTTNDRIYAIGDVASEHRFTHAADAQARLVVRNALFFGRGKATDLVIPSCTYTSPEIAQVGAVADNARKESESFDTVTVPFADVDRARLDGATEGFLRVHLRRGTDEIAGATIVGENVGELLPLLTHAITAGTRLSALGDTIFPYPTRGEILRKAADQWRRGKLTPRAKRLFAGFFKVV